MRTTSVIRTVYLVLECPIYSACLQNQLSNLWTLLQAQTDVLGCRVNSGSSVTVIDGWNPTPNYTPNQLDNDSEDGIDLCVHTTEYTDGRISCL